MDNLLDMLQEPCPYCKPARDAMQALCEAIQRAPCSIRIGDGKNVYTSRLTCAHCSESGMRLTATGRKFLAWIRANWPEKEEELPL